MPRNRLFSFLLIISSAGILYGCNDSQAQADAASKNAGGKLEVQASAEIQPAARQRANAPLTINSHFGNYLCGRFAQHHQDWENASRFLDRVIEGDKKNLDLKKRAMVLSIGSGQASDAIRIAHELKEQGEANSLVQLFLAIESFAGEDYKEASLRLDGMPEGGMADFINPLLKAWAAAAEGKLELQNLPGNPVHSYHAALIAGYLGKYGEVPAIIQNALKSSGLSLSNLESIADMYAGAGRKKEAIDTYTMILKEDPENAAITRKLESLRKGETAKWADKSKVTSPKQGVAQALFDMARVLFGEYSDDSARVFSQMALYLQPEMNEARLLIAVIDTRNDRFQEAINQYQAIGENDDSWPDARKRMAELMAKTGRTEEAIDILSQLVSKNKDVDAQIQIGDIFRQKDNFASALDSYNQAEEMMGGEIPPQYWHLLYARGMTLERLRKWNEAEKDLIAALELQPEHPYIMNYLGYGWTEQGIRFDEALELLQKAAALQPSDGYISDSLGWVYYNMGKYGEAIPHLEKSVELMPYDPVINDHLGDAYWQVGRRLEAEFQWQRAKNYSDDEDLTVKLRQKLISGLRHPEQIKEAKGEAVVGGESP